MELVTSRTIEDVIAEINRIRGQIVASVKLHVFKGKWEIGKIVSEYLKTVSRGQLPLQQIEDRTGIPRGNLSRFVAFYEIYPKGVTEELVENIGWDDIRSLLIPKLTQMKNNPKMKQDEVSTYISLSQKGKPMLELPKDLIALKKIRLYRGARDMIFSLKLDDRQNMSEEDWQKCDHLLREIEGRIAMLRKQFH